MMIYKIKGGGGGGRSLASSLVPLELCAGRPLYREENEGPVCDFMKQ